MKSAERIIVSLRAVPETRVMYVTEFVEITWIHDTRNNYFQYEIVHLKFFSTFFLVLRLRQVIFAVIIV